ncbi:competence type IV pilus ATPase ComGA, partial [Enterococcus faecalis]
HTNFATIYVSNLLGVQRPLIKLGGPEHELAECLQVIIYQQILTTTINKEQVAAILYDYFFFKEAVIKSSGQKNLRKARAYGFIT